MRSVVVVVPNPGVGQVLCLRNTVELESVEDVFTEGAVEALDVAVLTGFAFLDEHQFDASVGAFAVVAQGLGDELGSVINAYAFWCSTPLNHPVELGNDALTGDALGNGNTQGFAVKVINQVERPEGRAIKQAVAHEIHAPSEVRHQGLKQWLLDALGQATLRLSSNVEPALGVDAVQSLVVDHMAVLADPMVHLPKSP